MRDLDDIDRTIIQLLLENARRPYSDIADHVDLSAPAVADRIRRLESLGVINSFTLDLDSTALRGGTEVLVDLAVHPGQTTEVVDGVADRERVEHRYVTADAHVIIHATLGADGIDGLLADVDTDALRDIDVRLLSEATWMPQVAEVTLAVDCDECGNPVTSDGETSVIDGTQYHFCCGSCLGNFEARFDRLSEGV